MNAERISEDSLEKPPREPLTRQRIVRTALRIMDQDGLDAVSMRRIGRELGVEAMSLYNHVRDKDDILDSICEEAMAEFRTPTAEEWTEGARLAAREYRRLLLAHPNVLTLLTGRKAPFTNPESMRGYEFALDLFRTAGLSPADSLKAFHVFGGYILGYVTMELGTMVGGVQDEEHIRAHQEMARVVETADLPRLQEALPFLSECDIEEQFEFGLELLIEGIRTATDRPLRGLGLRRPSRVP
jgi:AcrR family transcriptional regulator